MGDYDISQDEKNKVIFLSNNKISKNISDKNLKWTVLSSLTNAGAENHHYAKTKNQDFKIKIVPLGKFAILQIFMLTEDYAKGLVNNIKLLVSKATTDIDKSWNVNYG